MQNLNLIPDDGYTRSGYLTEKLPLHTEVRFDYRPLTHQERYKFNDTITKRPGFEQSAMMCVMLARKIVSWNLTDAKGQPLAIEAGNVAKLVPVLIERMYSCVMGYEAGDLDLAREAGEHIDDAMEAAVRQLTVGAVREERDEKNSSAG